jgi:tRNA A37 threonylcarbamoyladenosine synthetase subunit TsaC/SUA5/YrdC
LIWPIHPVNPEKRVLGWIVEALRDDGVIILPTDTVYAFACSLDSPRAIEKMYKLKDLPESKPLSLLCKDVAMASNFAQGISNSVFRFMKLATPGPFTFLFKANRFRSRSHPGSSHSTERCDCISKEALWKTGRTSLYFAENATRPSGRRPGGWPGCAQCSPLG